MGYVEGQTPEVAQKLLALADEHDIDQSEVRAVDGGFEVPDDLSDAYAETLGKDDKPKRGQAKSKE